PYFTNPDGVIHAVTRGRNSCPSRLRHHRTDSRPETEHRLEKIPTPPKTLVVGYVREFGAVLRIADRGEGTRLEIKQVGARDCPGRRLRMSRSYREDGRAAR